MTLHERSGGRAQALSSSGNTIRPIKVKGEDVGERGGGCCVLWRVVLKQQQRGDGRGYEVLLGGMAWFRCKRSPVGGIWLWLDWTDATCKDIWGGTAARFGYNDGYDLLKALVQRGASKTYLALMFPLMYAVSRPLRGSSFFFSVFFKHVNGRL